MCGITGFWQRNHFSMDTAQAVAEKMADRIAHRGPDDRGVWIDKDAGVVLAHRRLSILDLSPAGHQPMVSLSRRYVIVLNGEIYNHLEIRKELGDVAWRGHSDTETFLQAFEKWGIEETLIKSVGMFAFALWDCRDRVLTIARDRIGEKPLYYGFQKNTFLFGSELKALKAHPDFMSEIDRDVLCSYFRYCCIPAPFSIYKGIRKLQPGHYLQFPLTRSLDELRQVLPKAYWSLEEVAAKGLEQPFRGTDQDAIVVIEEQLKQSIRLQMIADVPLGAFLSGGVDSSTVVALMQSLSSRPIRTFSIGFDESDYNEAVYAKAVAAHLGTEHTEQYVSPAEAMRVIPGLGLMYDEPFADSSQIPTFLVAQMASKYVTVSLSGDAGDELFCGYNRYALADIWRKIEKVPFSVRRATGHVLSAVPGSAWKTFFHYVGKICSLPSNMADKLEKLSAQLETVNGVGDLYHSLVSEVTDPSRLILGAREPETWLTTEGLKPRLSDLKLQMMYWDGMTYLPDDILVKVDRAAMANSLETRVPLLDHRVIELAWSMPLSMKIRDGQMKWLLRQVLYKHVPRKLIERPKMGFAIPVGDWMRGPLKDWVEGLLDRSRLQREGFLDVEYVHSRWQEHLSGKRNGQSFLWTVLMFQSWLEGQK